MRHRKDQFYLVTWERQFRLRDKAKIIRDSLDDKSKKLNKETKKPVRDNIINSLV